MSLPRTAVIGAGISGLTAGKMLADYGIPYTCFETSDRVGGNWAFGNPNGHSSAYRSLHIDTSKHQLSFRDFPIPDEFPDFPHHTQIKTYLDAYADAFGLREHIRFSTGIAHAERLPGGWALQDQGGAVHRFDLLVVANGHHWDPRYADFPGTFDGAAFHSHHYVDPRTPLDLSGKRILVVGIGNSAADIAVELSSKALSNEVILSTRSGAWIVPKYIAGRPADKYYRTFPHIPLSWQRKVVQVAQPLTAGRPELFGLPTPNHKFFEAHPTQSVELPLRLGSGDILPKPNVTRLDGHTVHFADGTSHEVDVIIHATGYNITFPFFDKDFISAPDNHLPLYKRMFKPGIDDLIFVGFAQATPTLFPFVECQARLVAAYAAGHYRLPPAETMERVIVADEKKFIGHMVPSARHTQQVDYFIYEHDMRTRELPRGRVSRSLRGAFWAPSSLGSTPTPSSLHLSPDAAGATPLRSGPTPSPLHLSPDGAGRRCVRSGTSFDSAGVRCAAVHWSGDGDALATEAGRPIVVMAHGLGGTVDSGLEPFAAGLAAAGLDVLAFDYRGFGASEGAPRQTVSLAGQLADFRAAMTAAAALPGVDPGRLVLWGASLSGGYVIEAAADRHDVAAVVSLTPLVDGIAAGRHAIGTHAPVSLLRSLATGVRSRTASVRGRAPSSIPLVGPPGTVAALTLDGYYDAYLSIAGPTWINRVDAGVILALGTHRPGRAASRVRCPMLMQIADFDRSAPPRAAAKTAFRARAEVRHYPCDHFDVWPSQPYFDAALAHQIAFLTRVLRPPRR